MIEQDLYVKVDPKSVVSDNFEGETVLIDFENGKYFSIKGSGAVIWDHLVRGISVEALIVELARYYSVPAAKLETSVRSFVEELLKENLIKGLTEPESSETPSTKPTGLVFEQPLIEGFDDLQDLILIDPVHDSDEERGWPVKPGV